MVGGSYDEEYAVEDGDEACGLLQHSHRRTPLHINNYLSQMEKLQKQRKQRQRQGRILAAALGFVTLCGVLWTRQSHAELVSALFPRPDSQRASFARTSTFCDTRQCIDLLPRSALDMASPTCESVEPGLYSNLVRYVFDAHYANKWPHDPTMQCSKPSLVNFTTTAVPDARFDSCRYHAAAIEVKAVGMFGTSGNVELAKATLVPSGGTPPLGTQPFVSHVSEKWNRNRLQGLPHGVINPTHDDGIWLTVYFPTDVPSGLNIEVRRGDTARTVQLTTTVALPPQTGLAAIRLDREWHQAWPAGAYLVAIDSTTEPDNSQVVPFTVLPSDRDGQNAVFREKYDLLWASPASANATSGDVCASMSENVTVYCACQGRERQN